MIPDAKPDEQEDPFDRLSQHIGPRHLIVVLSEKDVTKSNGHTLKHHRRYRRFIPEYDGISHNQDAFSYLVINNSLLEFRFQGEEPITRKRHYITYKFRFQKEALYLLGYNHHTVNRASGMFQETTIDLSKKEQKKVFGSMSSPRHQVKKGLFNTKNTWTPCDIRDPLNFSPEQDALS